MRTSVRMHNDVIKIYTRNCQSPNSNSASIYFWPLGGHFTKYNSRQIFQLYGTCINCHLELPFICSVCTLSKLCVISGKSPEAVCRLAVLYFLAMFTSCEALNRRFTCTTYVCTCQSQLKLLWFIVLW